jgi:hypothetical protein
MGAGGLLAIKFSANAGCIFIPGREHSERHA